MTTQNQAAEIETDDQEYTSHHHKPESYVVNETSPSQGSLKEMTSLYRPKDCTPPPARTLSIGVPKDSLVTLKIIEKEAFTDKN